MRNDINSDWNLRRRNKKNKNTSSLKNMIVKRLIIIIVFLLVMIGITYYFVSTSDKNPIISFIEKKQAKNTEPASNEKVLSLSDTYNENDLNIKSYKEIYKNIEVEYYQIDGLKDDSIEIQINYNLKKDLENAIDEALENSKSTNSIDIFSNIDGNFANTISIYYNIYVYDEENDYEIVFRKNIPENYDLTTGNRIKLKDMFTQNANVGNIISTNAYNDILVNTADIDSENNDYALTIADYNDIEDRIFELVCDYNAGKEIEFSFDEQRIMLLEYDATILYKNNLEDIAIYNKYKTNESIFDGTYSKLKNIPVIAKRSLADYQVVEQGENYYIDVSLFDFYSEEEKNEEVYNAAKEIVDEYIASIKEELKNSDKFTIINRSYNLSFSGDYNQYLQEWIADGNYELSCGTYRFEVTKSLFKSEIYNKIIDIFREFSHEGIVCSDNLFGMYLIYDDNNEKYLDNLDEDNWGSVVLLDNLGNIIEESEIWNEFD